MSSSVFDTVQDKIKQARENGKKDEETAQVMATKVQESIMLLEMTKNESRATKERLKAELIEAQKCLEENQYSQNPTVRRAVVKALIGWHIHPQQLSSKEDAERIVARLSAEGLVEEDPKGTLAILGKSFSIPADNFFEVEDIAEMEKQFGFFQDRFRIVLRKTSNLSVKTLLAGAKGHLCLFVPPEKYNVGEGTRWRAGGTLIMESDGRFIRALEAIGKIETIVADSRKLEAKKLPVKCEVRSIFWKQPPLLPFKTEEEKARSQKTQMLWYLIKRGLDFAVWETKTSAMGTLSSKEFFVDGKLGKYFLNPEEAWQDTRLGKEMWISRPAMLLERFEKDGRKFIKVVEAPNYLADWLAECNCSLEGEDFTGVNQPLQKLLRYYANKAARDAEKETAANTAQEILRNLS